MSNSKDAEEVVTNNHIDLANIPSESTVLEGDETLKQLVFDMICSGWTPASISRHLVRNLGVQVRPYAIKKFADNVPPVLVLPPSFIKTKLNEIDVQIDAVAEMQRLLKVTEDRLSTALLIEDIAPDEGSTKSKGITVEGTRMTQVYWQMLQDFVKVQQSLGEINEMPQAIAISASGNGPGNGNGRDKPRTLREIMNESRAAVATVDQSDANDDSSTAAAETAEPTLRQEGSADSDNTDYEPAGNDDFSNDL